MRGGRERKYLCRELGDFPGSRSNEKLACIALLLVRVFSLLDLIVIAMKPMHLSSNNDTYCTVCTSFRV